MSVIDALLADGPARLWDLGSGLADLTGNGAAATLVGAPTVTSDGVTLTADGQGIDTDLGSSGSAFTVEMWLQTSDDQGLVFSCRNGAAPSLSAFLGSNPVGPIVAGGLAVGITGDNLWAGMTTRKPVNDGAEHHFVFVLSGTPGVAALSPNFQVWVDGVYLENRPVLYQSTNAPLPAGSGFYFGRDKSSSGGDGGGHLRGRFRRIGLYQKALTGAQIQAHFVAGGGTLPATSTALPEYERLILQRRVTGAWPLDDTQGPARDLRGRRPVAAPMGQPSPLFGGFDGPGAATRSVQFPLDSALTSPLTTTGGAMEMTFEAWVKIESFGVSVPLYANAQSQFSSDFTEQGVSVDADGRIRLAQYNGSWNYLVSLEPVPLGEWFHVVAKYDRTLMSLRINAVAAGSKSVGSITAAADQIWLHAAPGYSPSSHPCRMAFASLYEVALPDSVTDAGYAVVMGGGGPTAVFTWWDGAARHPATLKGWWDGAEVRPASLREWT